MFKVKLLFSAHLDMWSISSKMVNELTDRIIRYVSSAYLSRELSECIVFRSDAQIIKKAGPMPDPWTILALIPLREDIDFPNLVQCILHSRNSIRYLWTASLSGRSAHLAANVEWRTMLKALEIIEFEDSKRMLWKKLNVFTIITIYIENFNFLPFAWIDVSPRVNNQTLETLYKS